MKTSEEIYDYVLTYKNNMLNNSNKEKTRMFDRANDTDAGLNSHLITLCALLFTVIGGVIASNLVDLDNSEKIILAVATVNLFLSICFGLASYFETARFWTIWGRAEHEKGGMIYGDNSKTVEELELLVEKIMEKNKTLPLRIPAVTRIFQVGFFITGLISLFILFVVMLRN